MDYWNTEGDRDQSESWTGFTQFTILEEKTPEGYTLSGQRLTKMQTTSRPDYQWPEIWKEMSEAAQRKEKQKWAIEKPERDHARRLRGFFVTDPADAEYKETIKNAWRKLEVPMPAAIPCKTKGGKYRETCSTSGTPKTIYACIVEADESTRKRLERTTLHKDHEDHVAGKRIHSSNQSQSCAQNFPMPSSDENSSMQKQQWTKNGKNSRKYQHDN